MAHNNLWLAQGANGTVGCSDVDEGTLRSPPAQMFIHSFVGNRGKRSRDSPTGDRIARLPRSCPGMTETSRDCGKCKPFSTTAGRLDYASLNMIGRVSPVLDTREATEVSPVWLFIHKVGQACFQLLLSGSSGLVIDCGFGSGYKSALNYSYRFDPVHGYADHVWEVMATVTRLGAIIGHIHRDHANGINDFLIIVQKINDERARHIRLGISTLPPILVPRWSDQTVWCKAWEAYREDVQR
jgi:hypothetical protein